MMENGLVFTYNSLLIEVVLLMISLAIILYREYRGIDKRGNVTPQDQSQDLWREVSGGSFLTIWDRNRLSLQYSREAFGHCTREMHNEVWKLRLLVSVDYRIATVDRRKRDVSTCVMRILFCKYWTLGYLSQWE